MHTMCSVCGCREASDWAGETRCYECAVQGATTLTPETNEDEPHVAQGFHISEFLFSHSDED